MRETAGSGADIPTGEPYEPPAVVVLGNLAELTAVEGSLHDESDHLLKADVAVVERPLECLRTIRTR